jgi:hypothetical protein
MIIANNGGNNVHIKFMSPATTNSFSVQLGSAVGSDTLFMLNVPFTGPVYAIRGSGSSSVTVTEFT